MTTALLILAVLGVAALIWRLVRAGYALVRRGVEAFLARESAALRERQGDITGLVEADAHARSARRSRLRAALTALLWLALLAVPPLTPWSLEIYAACSLVWLIGDESPIRPAHGLRSTKTPDATE